MFHLFDASRLACWRVVAVLIALASVTITTPARGQNEGQDDLNKAMEAKLSAENFGDLTRVIKLLDSSLEAGLDDDNQRIARNMLAGTLLDRATMLHRAIISQERIDRQVFTQVLKMRQVAMADLERALKIRQDDLEAHFLLARLLALREADRDRAVKELDIVVKSEQVPPPLQAQAHLLRGSLQEDEEKRLADYARAIELMPDETEALSTRARFYLSRGRPEEALADLEAALKLEQDDADLYELRGMVLFVKGDYEQSLSSFDRAIELSPDDAGLYINRARAHYLNDETDKALSDLDIALQKQPESLAAFLLRSQIRELSGDTSGAMSDVDAALQIEPGNVTALSRRVQVLAAAGKMDEAIDQLRSMSQGQPDNIELLILLGELYVRDKQLSRGIKMFDAVLATDEKNAQALRDRGDALLSLGRQQEAIVDFEAALKSDPDNYGVLNNLAWVLATSPEDKLRDGKRAIKLATKACELTDYKLPHILSTLAASYAETGDFETAKKWSSKAVDIGDQQYDQQLSEELKSYQGRKPWREMQSAEDKGEEDKASDDEPTRIKSPARRMRSSW